MTNQVVVFLLLFFCFGFHFQLMNFNREEQDKAEGGKINPNLVAELKSLRSHRTQLESHMISLQVSRKNLLGQLEGLMRLLKVGS